MISTYINPGGITMENIENIPQESIAEENVSQESIAEETIIEETIPQQPVLKASPFADSPYEMNHVQVEATAKPNATPKKKKSSGKAYKFWISALLILALVVASCGITAYVLTNHFEQQNLAIVKSVRSLQNQIKALEKKIQENSYTGNGNSISGTPGVSDGLTPGQIHAQNKNSVVGIANQGSTTNIFGQVTETASAGSGFIISADGYIVTNYHVIEGATTLTVITNELDEYSAKVVGYDEKNDFALIKIDATGLTPVKLGSSNDLIVGDQVAAIGNPLGEFTNSLTVGYISVKVRSVTIDGTIINMLQTDTAINPGNSGGPLFNMKGEVIGIVTAKSTGDAVEGIGFAIPIDDIKEMITELQENGYISAPYMGIIITNELDGMGVYVNSVESGSPAEAAGLKKGDIIVGLGDYETTTLAELDRALRNFEPYETTTIYVYRNRQVLELTITFTEKNQPAS